MSSEEYHAHFDCFSGAAGDMLLAACLDAADSLPHPLPRLEAASDARSNVVVALETKQSEILLAQITHDLENGLPELKGEFELSVERVWRGSGRIAAKKLHVKSIFQHQAAPVPGTADESSHKDHHSHSHSDSHSHHHSHEHAENHHSHEHSHSKVEQDANLNHSHDHSHSSGIDHDHSHHHTHQGGGKDSGHTHNKLRNLPQIAQMLHAAPSKYIPRIVASLAIEAFTALAHAEMHTHGAESIDQVHFHEVGAVDSIVDTVGTLLALHYLSVDLGSGDGQDCNITCSRLPMGEGTVWTDHGLLPVPAPATMRLMIGMPLCPGPSGVTGELVTPTAAALLRVLTGVNNRAGKRQCSNYSQPKGIVGRPPSMIPRAVGLGAGTKDFERHPNVLRLILGDCCFQQQADTETDANKEVIDEEVSRNHIENVSAESGSKSEAANIDDATPELMAHAIDLLLENGAIDAWVVPIVMKKGRPSHSLNCLCHGENTNESKLLEIMFRHTTTLGIRIHRNILRASLQRRFLKVQLPYRENSRDGEVDVKVSSFRNDEVVSFKAEFDQCKIIAKESNVPLKIVSSTSERLAWQMIL
ncbi:hypothetical protein ACHAXM_008175 [Skeletonema potamos]